MREVIASLLKERSGHFAFESGHHGAVWLELELLFLEPGKMRPVVEALSARIAEHAPEAICGPLTEGAFLALLVALELGLPFAYAQREQRDGTAIYRIAPTLAAGLHGRQVAVIDDVINAGSAVVATLAALKAAGAQPVAVGAMAVYGGAAAALASSEGLPLEALDLRPGRIWNAADCPLCAEGIPLDQLAV